MNTELDNYDKDIGKWVDGVRGFLRAWLPSPPERNRGEWLTTVEYLHAALEKIVILRAKLSEAEATLATEYDLVREMMAERDSAKMVAARLAKRLSGRD